MTQREYNKIRFCRCPYSCRTLAKILSIFLPINYIHHDKNTKTFAIPAIVVARLQEKDIEYMSILIRVFAVSDYFANSMYYIVYE